MHNDLTHCYQTFKCGSAKREETRLVLGKGLKWRMLGKELRLEHLEICMLHGVEPSAQRSAIYERCHVFSAGNLESIKEGTRMNIGGRILLVCSIHLQ